MFEWLGLVRNLILDLVILLLLSIPLLGGVLVLMSESHNPGRALKICLTTSCLAFVCSLQIWCGFDQNTVTDQFILRLNTPFPHLGTSLEGISIVFVLLTTFLIPCCVLGSWEQIMGSTPENPN